MPPTGKVATKSSNDVRNPIKAEPSVRIKGAVLLALRLSGKDCHLCRSLPSDEAERCSCKGTRKIKFTQPEVEIACGLPKAILTAYEHDKCDATLKVAMRLAEYFNVPLSELITEESMLGLAGAHNQIQDALGIGSEAVTE